MQPDTETRPEQLPRGAARRVAAVSLLRSLLVATAVVVAYFVLPLTSPLTADTVAALVIGLVAVGGLLAWQIRGIVTSPYPPVKAVAALAVSLPVFLVLFATTYYLMGHAEPDTWSEPLTRLDAAYFTVTVFATVGFGDITAVSETARAVTTVQMIGNVVLVGVIARVVVGAVQEGLRRQGRPS